MDDDARNLTVGQLDLIERMWVLEVEKSELESSFLTGSVTLGRLLYFMEPLFLNGDAIVRMLMSPQNSDFEIKPSRG